MPRSEEKLKLGKRAAFVKGRLKRLRQVDETWEADFQALPKPITQSQTHYRGMVIAPDGSTLADSHVEGRPTVNDMATLLAHAMRRPLTGKAHRPRRIHVRGHHQWRELFPHLAELGIEVAVQKELPQVQEAYEAHLRQLREAHRRGMVKPTADQQAVEKLFPTIAQWVRGYGHKDKIRRCRREIVAGEESEFIGEFLLLIRVHLCSSVAIFSFPLLVRRCGARARAAWRSLFPSRR